MSNGSYNEGTDMINRTKVDGSVTLSGVNSGGSIIANGNAQFVNLTSTGVLLVLQVPGVQLSIKVIFQLMVWLLPVLLFSRIPILLLIVKAITVFLYIPPQTLTMVLVGFGFEMNRVVAIVPERYLSLGM